MVQLGITVARIEEKCIFKVGGLVLAFAGVTIIFEDFE